MTIDQEFAKRISSWPESVEHSSHIIADIRTAERNRCIAALVAEQPEGMRAVMEEHYRGLLEAGT